MPALKGHLWTHQLSLFLIVLGASALLTALARPLATRFDFVSRPRAGRWSQRTVALGGGVPMVLGITFGLLLLKLRWTVAFLPPFLAMATLGLIDDLRSVPPAGKLVVQAIAATYVVSFGWLLPIPITLIAIPVTVVWIVGVTNAVNLLDNMDGLSSGVATVAALSYAAMLGTQGQYVAMLIALCCAGGTAGFFLHNYHPARIFMGDAGSLPMGFLLAVLTTRVRFDQSFPWLLGLLCALLPLAVPLFDTGLVFYTRRRARRPFLLGGRDHSSHRLVALGFSERKAVTVLLALALVAGLAATSAATIGYSSSMVALTATVILFVLAAIFLSDAPVYEWSEDRGQAAEPDLVQYAAEVTVDIAVVALVWTVAHLIRFQDAGPEVVQDYLRLTVVPFLPYLIAVKIAAFFFSELYRGVWRSISVHDVFLIFKAASLGTLLLVLASALYDRLANLSRIVIVLDWSLTFLGVLATRASIRAFRNWTQKFSSVKQKVAVIAPLSLKPLLQAQLEQRGLDFVGIIDAEPGRSSDSKSWLGTIHELDAIIQRHNIAILYASEPESIKSTATQEGSLKTPVLWRRLRIELE